MPKVAAKSTGDFSPWLLTAAARLGICRAWRATSEGVWPQIVEYHNPGPFFI
jgi:hypothetical protein